MRVKESHREPKKPKRTVYPHLHFPESLSVYSSTLQRGAGCPDEWGLKDANVHAGGADLPQRLTLHQWKWKLVNQRAGVALVPTHHSLWHCQPRQEHINHKHGPKHCAEGTAVSHPSIHLAPTSTHTTHYTMMRWTCKDKHSWMPKRTDWQSHTY